MNRMQRGILIAILFTAFALRIGFAFYWQSRAESAGQVFRLGDSHSYWVLAEQIAAGKPYQYGSENASVFRAPLYPILLSPFTRFSSLETGVMSARVAGCCLGTLSVYLMFLLATRIGGNCAGLACGAICAIYPAAIGMSATILSEALFMPLMVLHLLYWQLSLEERTNRGSGTALAAGCFAALGVLARPSWLLFVPFSIGMSFFARRDKTRFWRQHALILVAFCLTMAPWWVRNASITGRFVPTTLQVGPSLYDGLHANATGASDEGMAFMDDIRANQIREDAQSTQPLPSTFEYRVNQRAMQESLDWANSNPTEVMMLAFRKFGRTWSLWPDGGDINSLAMRLALSVSCFGTVLLALLGSLKASRFLTSGQRFSIILCWLPCIYFTLLHMVFVGSIRYREPAVFVLAALAGCGVAYIAGCATNHTAVESARLRNIAQGSRSVSSEKQSDPPID